MSRLPTRALILVLLPGLWVASCSGSGLDELTGGAVDAPTVSTDTASFNTTDTPGDIGTPTPPSDAGATQGDASRPPTPDTVTPEDTAPPEDTGGLCDEGGCFGAPCEEDGDCFSGLCVEHMGDTVCTKTCDADCPAGWSCEQVDFGGDVATYICVSNFEHLCRPCLGADDCTSDATEAACIDYGGQGSFCGAMCDGDADCPEGFACQQSVSTRGGQSSQCVDVDGVCECSALAAGLGLVTGCSVSNEHGTCDGIRSCTDDGLTDCDAATPAPEICNGLDDNCDGEVDEVDCDDDNPCTSDDCGGADGCLHTPAGGAPCDDGDPATGGDTCTDAGDCVGEIISCPEGPCVANATPNGADCDIVFKLEGAACDDGDADTKGDVCDGSEGCEGTPYTCEPAQCEISATTNGAGCDVDYWAAGTTCDDDDPTTQGDQCDGQGGCAGDTYACEPAPCEAASQPNGESCDVTFKVAGTACDDASAATKNDACDGQGGCAGVTYTCEPAQCEVSATPNGSSCDVDYWASGTACDDDDPATTGDSCDGQGGCAGQAYTCAPGSCEVAAVPNGADCDITYALQGAACDDGDPQTMGDQCNGQGGCSGTPYACAPELCEIASVPDGVGCDVTPAQAGEVCDDSDPATKGDACDGAGSCVGTIYGCVPGPCEAASVPNGDGCDTTPVAQGLACDDGDPGTAGDLCDGQGHCLGTPLTCEPTQCELSSVPDGEGCVVVNAPAAVACDDGDPGTKLDICDGFGGCQGTLYTCEAGPCEAASLPNGTGCDTFPMAAGLPCDDGDPDTKDDVCDGQSACAGSPYTCTPSQCEATSAPDGDGCQATFRPFGVACDDDDLTTKIDICDGQGGCGGEPILCVPDQCEAASVPNGFDCDVSYMAPGMPCDDSDLGTKDDVCAWWGDCGGTAYTCEPGPCESESVPDGVGCVVSYELEGALCDDGDPTTMYDACDGSGGCAGDPYTCEPTQCQASSTPNGLDCDITDHDDTTTCDDGDLETKDDLCDGSGGCAGTPYACAVGQCTTSSTHNGEGCDVVHSPPTQTCNDGDTETKDDLCDGSGGCVGTPYTCPLDQCDVSATANGAGCDVVHRDAGLPCNDGALTTKDDVCDGAGGCSGSPYTCVAGTCMADSVHNGEGCDAVYEASGTSCDDGDASTDPDTCNGAGACVGTPLCDSGTVVFNYTGGAQQHTVSACAGTLTFEVWGARGGHYQQTSYAGRGGYAKGSMSGLAGQTITIYVGGEGGYSGETAVGGYNGGGTASASQYGYTVGGGGASDVRIGGTSLSDRVIVGGGGGGSAWCYNSSAVGGDGGGLVGEDGGHSSNSSSGMGHGGTQSAGGGPGNFGGGSGQSGLFGTGGSANNSNAGCGGAGGGGGGYYGGGGGAHGGGGGGGSSYLSPSMTNTLTLSGQQDGHGQVILSW